MAEFQVRSDAVDVEHIMRQIRQRIKEKRGVDYSEEELRALASVKLEKFIDPSGVRSDLVQQFRHAHPAETQAPAPNYAFEEGTLYDTHRGIVRAIRRLLRPLLKLFINPDPLVSALNIQAQLNERNARFQTEYVARQRALDELRYEVMHNLVLELTRTTVEVRNLRMRLDAMAGRLDFDERRQRAFEGVVEYRKPDSGRSEGSAGSGGSGGSQSGSAGSGRPDDDGQRTRKRRRRRRRVPSSGMPPGGAPGGGDSGGESGGGSGEGGGHGGPAEGGEAPSQ